MRMFALSVVTIFFTAPAFAGIAVDVTSCGQYLRPGDVGTLQADIDCSGAPEQCSQANVDSCGGDPSCTDAGCAGIMLGNQATVVLNGHTLTSGAVYCVGRCTVVGPGTINGIPANPGGILGRGAIRVSGGVAINGAEFGINSSFGKVTASDVTISNSTTDGISARFVRALNVQSSNNGRFGIISHTRISAQDVATNNNVGGILSLRGLRATDVVATGNTEFGVDVAQGGVVLRDSTLTGNGKDIVTQRTPRLIDTLCGTSNRGVCSQD